MTIVSVEDPLASAVVGVIQTGNLTELAQLLADHVGLAMTRVATPDGATRTLLHIATDWPGHFPGGAATVTMLVEAGANVNARFHDQRGKETETPLHWAASSNDVNVLDALLDAGADIEAPGAVIAGGTPLMDATAFGQWNAAYRLIGRGAQTNAFSAASLGLMDRLDDHLGDRNAPDDKLLNDAFWAACHGGQLRIARYLLNRGADLNRLPDWQPLTALDAAVGSAMVDVVAWLRDQGAKTASELQDG